MQPVTAPPYRKLPGRLRGIGYGARLWMAPDHLLLVRTRMFREEYKRFYLRDIQAIVVAACPRFLISFRSALIAFAWVIPWLYWISFPPGFSIARWWWAIAALLAVAWLVVSFRFSCTCRLYTAVSNDELPSLYRIWTARKFLDQVKPSIDESQGALESNWAEAVESHAAGPASAPPTTPAAVAPALRSHTSACLVLVASLLAAAALDLLTLHSGSIAVGWIVTCLSLIQISSAIVVMVERQRRILRAAMQRVAVAVLAVRGLLYYAAAVSAAFANPGRFVGFTAVSRLMLPQFALLREIAAATYVVLALIGLAIILQPGRRIS